MLKKVLLVAAAATISTVSMAETSSTVLSEAGFTFSGNVGLTSDYRWRGQTQTQNDPAIQGSFTLAHNSGFYFSAFASNVDFGDSAHLELDPSIGYTTALDFGGVKPTLDVGLAYYNYPSDSDINWPELYAKLGFASVFTEGDSLTPSVAYTNKYGGKATTSTIGKDVNNWNVNLAYTVPFAEGFGGVASVGYSKADQAIYNNKDNYVDWKVGVTYSVKSIEGLTAELDVVGSTISKDDLSSVEKRYVGTGAVFTVTKTF